MPLGVDPRESSSDDGIFVFPKEYMKGEYKCLDEFYIGHYRDKEGYSDNWFDALEIDEEYYYYYFKVPEVNGEMYLTVETYYQDIIPNECTTQDYTFPSGKTKEVNNPLLYFMLYKWNEREYKYIEVPGKGKYYSDGMHNPLLIYDYSADDQFLVYVQYMWFNSPAKDYTFKVYSKHDL